MELVFIRHGESEANVLQREDPGFFCGRWDCDLTENGIRQAESLKGSAAVRCADAVYCSPLRRTLQTAAGFTDGIVIPDGRIMERSLGDFEGKRMRELAGTEEYRKYFTDPRFWDFRSSFTVAAPNGENYADVVRRVTPFLREIAGKGHRKAVVVSHAIAIKCMIRVICGLSEEETFRITVKHCDPIAIGYDGRTEMTV